MIEGLWKVLKKLEGVRGGAHCLEKMLENVVWHEWC
jgi:hypothetical protein